MPDSEAEENRTPLLPEPALGLVGDESSAEDARVAQTQPASEAAPPSSDPGARFFLAIGEAEQRATALAARVERVRAEIALVRSALVDAEARRRTFPHAGMVLRVGVLTSLAGLLGLVVWARVVDYALRVTSDTPTFIALVAGMAKRPFARQSPFLDADVATQHASPYMQALAFIWRGLGGSSESPDSLGGFLAIAGIAVFGFTLWCVFLYVRRLVGSTAAWISIPVVLGIFGPPHVIWASDVSLHAALYAGFFPQNVALGTTLLTLLALERKSRRSLIAGTVLAAMTMLVHPFTGVLLCVLATAESCRLAVRGERTAVRAPIALGLGFALGLLWPAYSLDSAFAETGMRGVFFVGVCVLAPLAAWLASRRWSAPGPSGLAAALGARFDTAEAAFRLAVVGALGTAALVAWELSLVQSPPEESARLAIYWVDDRWRWPLLLIAGAVGLSGLARLARRGQIVPLVWFSGCFAVGALGAVGLPLPVWYRFLLLCQVPLAVGVATVVAESRRTRTVALVTATFLLTLSVKVGTLVWAPPTTTYFTQPLQPAWSLGHHIPPGNGLVATDPATAYFVPATIGRRVLTVDKGHVSSRKELAIASDGYDLLRRYYAGGEDWWEAAEAMWRRGVRHVIVAKQTTLDPPSLSDFIWQTARLETPAQRAALGRFFYQNNRIGTLVHDSEDFAVYRLDKRKLFPRGVTP